MNLFNKLIGKKQPKEELEKVEEKTTEEKQVESVEQFKNIGIEIEDNKEEIKDEDFTELFQESVIEFNNTDPNNFEINKEDIAKAELEKIVFGVENDLIEDEPINIEFFDNEIRSKVKKLKSYGKTIDFIIKTVINGVGETVYYVYLYDENRDKHEKITSNTSKVSIKESINEYLKTLLSQVETKLRETEKVIKEERFTTDNILN